MKIDISRMSGMRPATEPEALNDYEAAYAADCLLETGAIEGRPAPSVLRPLTRNYPRTLWRYPAPAEGSHWLEFPGRAHVIRSPITDDSWDRVYWTHEGEARYAPLEMLIAGTSLPAASLKLGVPAPVSRPVLSQGLAGNSQYTAIVFQESATQPALPTGGTFNFTTGTLTPPAGWSATQPPLATTSVWAVEFVFKTDAPGSTVTAGTWSRVKYTFEGNLRTDGNVGLYFPSGAGFTGTVRVAVYRLVARSDFAQPSSAPTPPTGGSFTWSTRAFTPPAGWQVAQPTFNYPVSGTWYRSEATATIPADGSAASFGLWSTPVAVVGTSDTALSPVAGPHMRYRIYRSSATPPAAPTGGYALFAENWADPVDVQPPVGWSLTPTYADGVTEWSCELLFQASGTNPIYGGSAELGTWSEPQSWAEPPTAPTSPQWQQTVFVYRQLASQPGAPGNGTLQIDSNVLVPPSDWVRSQPAPTTTPTYRASITLRTNAATTPQTLGQWTDLVQASFLPAQAQNEGRAYMETFVTLYDEEGPRSEISEVTNVDPARPVQITGLAPAPVGEYAVNRRRLYRTSYTGGTAAAFQLVAELPIGTTSFTDSVRQVDLGKTWDSETYEPPPDGLYGLAVTDSGVAIALRGREVWMTEPYLPHAWNPDYVQTLQHEAVAVVTFGQSVLVMTKGGLYVASGYEPQALRLTRLEDSQPCLSESGIVVTRGGCYYPSPDGLVAVSTNFQPEVITREWMTPSQWMSYNPGSFIAGLQNGRYHAFYTKNDGTAGELILDTTGKSAPMTLGVTAQVSAAFRDPATDQLYVARNDSIERIGKIGNPLTYTWRSKVFDLAGPRLLTAFLVDSEGPVTFRAYKDGELHHTKVLNGQVGRMPPGSRGRKWQFEVSGSAKTTRIRVAPSVAELYLQ